MKRIGNGHPKSIRSHNEMDIRVGKTTITCGSCKQPGHNRWSCKNRNGMEWTLGRGKLLSHVDCANSQVTIDDLV